MTEPHSPLDVLHERAQACEAEETAFRADAARKVEALARARTFAYRRLNTLRDMTTSAAAAPSEEDAPPAAVLTLCEALNWAQLTPARQAIVARLAPLADAVAAFAREPASEEAAPSSAARGAAVLAELESFEAWYGAEYGHDFWSLLDSYVPETPVVDF
jgi:hypothetical protein